MNTKDSEFEQAQQDEVKSAVLPKWLKAYTLSPMMHYRVVYLDGSFYLTGVFSTGPIYQKNPKIRYATAVEAYEHLINISLTLTKIQITFDESVDGHGGELDGINFLVESVDALTGQELLPAVVEEDKNLAVKFSYLKWLTEDSLNYINNPGNFSKAYLFLNNHPLFWFKHSKGTSANWETQKGMNYAKKIEPKDQNTMVTLQHGGHSPDDHYTRHNLDHRITSCEETYEQAVIAMAKKVHELYDLDGYER